MVNQVMTENIWQNFHLQELGEQTLCHTYKSSKLNISSQQDKQGANNPKDIVFCFLFFPPIRVCCNQSRESHVLGKKKKKRMQFTTSEVVNFRTYIE